MLDHCTQPLLKYTLLVTNFQLRHTTRNGIKRNRRWQFKNFFVYFFPCWFFFLVIQRKWIGLYSTRVKFIISKIETVKYDIEQRQAEMESTHTGKGGKYMVFKSATCQQGNFNPQSVILMATAMSQEFVLFFFFSSFFLIFCTANFSDALAWNEEEKKKNDWARFNFKISKTIKRL